MSDFDPYHKWLGIPPKDQPPHHYRLLGIEVFESDPDVIDAVAEQRVSFVRQCATGHHVAESQKLLNEIAAARLCLLNAEKKKAYDRALQAKLSEATPLVSDQTPQEPSDSAAPTTEPPRRSTSTLASFKRIEVEGAPEKHPLVLWWSGLEPAPWMHKLVSISQNNPLVLWASLGTIAILVALGVWMSGRTSAVANPIAAKTRPTAIPNPNPQLVKPSVRSTSISTTVNKLVTSPFTSMKLVLIPAGEFQMGSPPSEPERKNEEGPQKMVRFTTPFYLGEFEVTQGEYERVMGTNPSYFSASGAGNAKVSGQDTSRLPQGQRAHWAGMGEWAVSAKRCLVVI